MEFLHSRTHLPLGVWRACYKQHTSYTHTTQWHDREAPRPTDHVRQRGHMRANETAAAAERDRETERETERQRDRETEQRQSRERQRDRARQRQRQRDSEPELARV